MADFKKATALILTVALLVNLALMVDADGDDDKKIRVRKHNGKKECIQGWECSYWSVYCCNHTISDVFQVYQFEDLFPKRNSPVAHAVGFWDYHSFILAAATYEPLGFGTTGGKVMQMKEVAAFLAHVGAKTSCEFLLFFSLLVLILVYFEIDCMISEIPNR